MGQMISFSKHEEDGTADGYLATSVGARHGIVVIQEWWGLNDQIKGVADRFAAAGYHALAPDLYAGRVTQDPDEANHMMTGMDWDGAYRDVRGAVQRLKQDCDKVAVMGFCMGGAVTIVAGVRIPECDAAVCYYGIPGKEFADPKEMAVPFLGHFASEDDWCTPEAVAALKADLAGVSTPVEVHVYDGKQHAFFNEVSDAYDKDAAELSWDRTMTFLNAQM